MAEGTVPTEHQSGITSTTQKIYKAEKSSSVQQNLQTTFGSGETALTTNLPTCSDLTRQSVDETVCMSSDDKSQQSAVPDVMSMKSDDSLPRSIDFAEADNGEGEGVSCSACGARAYKSCFTCMASFCECHARPHYKGPEFKSHLLVDASEKILSAHPRFGPIELTSVKPDSVSLSWGPLEGSTGPQKFRVTWNCDEDQQSVELSDFRFTVEELTPGKKYTFSVAELMDDGTQGVCLFATPCTGIPQPEDVTVTTDLTSLTVSWRKPAGVDQVKYLLSLYSHGKCLTTISLTSPQRCFSELLMGEEYSISVCTLLKKRGQSDPVWKTMKTNVPVPENLSADCVMTTSVNLSWSLSSVMDQTPHHFVIAYHSIGTEPKVIRENSCSAVITDLKPDTEYEVNVYTKIQNGEQSQPSTKTIHTAALVPECLTVDSLTEESDDSWSAALSWRLSHAMGRTPHSFQISFHCEGLVLQTLSSHECKTVIRDLRPDTEYTADVCTVFPDGTKSANASITFYTREWTIVLLGKTGSGKSSTGNTILGEDAFRVGTCSKSETDECKAKSKTIRGRQIKIVDTPGLFDTDLSEKQLFSEITTCITECSPGPHAFIIMLKVEKYTVHEQEIVKKVEKLFESEALKHTVLLFTQGNQLNEGQTIEDFVKGTSQGQGSQTNSKRNQSDGGQTIQNSVEGTSQGSHTNSLKDLVAACGHRYHVIDNRYWHQEHEYRNNNLQVERLLHTIEEMVGKAGGCYTNEFLRLVEEKIQQEIGKILSEDASLHRPEVRQRARKIVQRRILAHRAAGITSGVLIGALLGPFTAVASAVSLLAGVGSAVKKKIVRRTQGVELVSTNPTESTTKQTSMASAAETTGAVAAGTGTTGTGIAAGVTAAAVVKSTAALVGVGTTGANIAAGVTAAVGAGATALGCGIAAGAVAGGCVVAGATTGGIMGADKIKAAKSKSVGEAILQSSKQTWQKNKDIVKRAYTYPSEKMNE